MFQQIEENKRLSVLLVFLVTALLGVVGWVIGMQFGAPWYVGVSIALALAVILGCISYYSGGQIVLAMSGAHPIEKADNPQLYNVVEEMSIAAGLPMPKIYVIEDSAPNAFATGRKPEEAVIAVTRGLLQKLNRDELQGVIAHEMSHVRNYDILFMTMMAVMVGSIALLCDAFLRASWYGAGSYRSRRSRSSGGGAIALLALVLAILAPLAAKLIQLAASRRREYLADASAALLTRYPHGLASALRKIANDPEPLEAANRATQHMYIVNPLKAAKRRAQSILSTHPPIEERIERLDRMSYVTSEQDAAARPAWAASAAQPSTPAASASAQAPMPLPSSVLAPAAAALASASPPAQPAAPVGQAGACPRCQQPLAWAKVAGRRLRACRACGGIWISRADVTELLHEAPDRLVAADRKFPNLVGVGWNRIAPKRCPQCGGPLTEAAVQGMSGVFIDQCAKCDGVWFDDGELAAVASAAARTPS